MIGGGNGGAGGLGGTRGGAGGAGGEGGEAGGPGGGMLGGRARGPQSAQSVPYAQELYACPGPPSSQSTSWMHSGPGGYAMYNDPLRLESAGAAQAMVQIDGGSTWLLATANGGIWKTTDLHASPVRWWQVLDGQPVTCTSISAMEARPF